MAANPALWADITDDLDAALAHAARAAAMRDAYGNGAGLEPLTAEALGLALGKHLEDAYTATERAIERIVLTVDGSRPRGADFHRELLRRAERRVEGLREPILSGPAAGQPSVLLGFRHAFRNSYAGYDIQRALPNVTLAGEATTRVAGKIEAFCRDFGIMPANTPPRFTAGG